MKKGHKTMTGREDVMAQGLNKFISDLPDFDQILKAEFIECIYG